MSLVAQQLRAAREAQNLSLDQIANLTKMRADHIAAIEEGRFDTFSATIYVRGSVKNIAGILKLDQAPLLAQLDAELNQSDKFSEPPPLVETKKTFLDTLMLLWAKLNWKVGFAGIGAMAVILIVGLSVVAWRHHQKSDPLKNLPPAVYQSGNPGDTLPLSKK